MLHSCEISANEELQIDPMKNCKVKKKIKRKPPIYFFHPIRRHFDVNLIELTCKAVIMFE